LVVSAFRYGFIVMITCSAENIPAVLGQALAKEPPDVLSALGALLAQLYSNPDSTASKLTELALSSAVALWISRGTSQAVQQALRLSISVLSRTQLARLSVPIPDNLKELLQHLKSTANAPKHTLADWSACGTEIMLETAAAARYLPVVFGGAGGQSESENDDGNLSIAAVVCGVSGVFPIVDVIGTKVGRFR
jgi:hypothetical protein